jgi:hypothetical protein
LQLAEVQGELASQTAEAAAQDVTRKGKTTPLTGQIDARTAQKDLLTAEITSLVKNEKALALQQTPTLSAPAPTGVPLPDSIRPLMSKALEKIGSPSLSASMVAAAPVPHSSPLIGTRATTLISPTSGSGGCMSITSATSRAIAGSRGLARLTGGPPNRIPSVSRPPT